MNDEIKVYGSWLGKIVESGLEQSIVRLLEGPMEGKEICVSAKDLPQVNATEETTMGNEITIGTLVDKYNAMVLTAVDLGLKNFKVVKTFRDKATGIKRCDLLHEEIQKSKSTAGDGEDEKKEAAVEKKSKPKKQAQGALADTSKIHVLVENPKRGKAKERFALYREGMLVSTYKEKVGNPSLALACLRWDVKHGFIKLTV